MIFHVVPLGDWLAAPHRPYAPDSLLREGFVHCAPDEETALAVASAYHREASGPLMVLLIDEDVLDARVRWEPADPPAPWATENTLFPRVYGPVNRTAVAGMLEIERDEAGSAVALALWS